VLLALLPVLAPPRPVLAVEPGEMLKDAPLEARARALSKELRCMVCQNQSIDDSEAPLAHDLRVLVRERLQAGDSDVQVVDFLVARYGEFVLLNPRLSWHTAVCGDYRQPCCFSACWRWSSSSDGGGRCPQLRRRTSQPPRKRGSRTSSTAETDRAS
jgi:Cytochrome C biogenesis protein